LVGEPQRGSADDLRRIGGADRRGAAIDLVILDLTMPRMDGAEAFSELRRMNPDVRVALASGYSEEEVSARFAGKAVAGVLQKPYTLGKLQELLIGLMPAPGGAA
jgi:CheY-like chemotaxis protein